MKKIEKASETLKYWKRKTYNHNYYTQQKSHSNLMEKSKLYRQAEVKRIQHHQTSLQQYERDLHSQETQKKGKTLKKKTQTIKKMPIGTYISIII